MNSSVSLWSTTALTALMLLAAGCGDEAEIRPDVHPAEGTLLINGEPAAGARVALYPADGSDFDQRGSRPWGTVEADGTFELRTYQEGDGVPAGTYKVSVVWMANPDSLGPSPDLLGGRYADPQTSPFEVTITEGENQLDPITIDNVTLRSRKRPPRAAVNDVDGLGE